MSKINVELMRKTRDWMNAHPEYHDQTTWHCGTSHCFFGIAEILHLRQNPSEVFHGDDKKTYEFARKALGLTIWQADYLSCVSRTIDEINKAVDAWTDPKPLSTNKEIFALSPLVGATPYV